MTPAQRKKRLEQLRKAGKKGGRSTKKKIQDGVLPADHYKKAGSKGGKASWKTL